MNLDSFLSKSKNLSLFLYTCDHMLSRSESITGNIISRMINIFCTSIDSKNSDSSDSSNISNSYNISGSNINVGNDRAVSIGKSSNTNKRKNSVICSSRKLRRKRR